MMSSEQPQLTETRPKEGMAGLAKGLAILELFGDGRDKLTVSDAAKGTALTRATARRCLLTLVECGYLDFDGKYFRPQPRLLRLGFAYFKGAAMPRIVQPVLSKIRDLTGESISLAVLDGDHVMYIARASAVHIVITGVTVGRRMPAHAVATGRVLLASLPANQLDAYLERVIIRAFTHKSIVDPNQLKQVIRDVGAAGYAINDEELEIGFRAMAVPVHDIHGHVIASMSIGSSAVRNDAQTMIGKYLSILQEGAANLRRILTQDDLLP